MKRNLSLNVDVGPLIGSFRPHYGPGVESASNTQKYQEYSLGSKGGRCVGLTLRLSCRPVQLLLAAETMTTPSNRTYIKNYCYCSTTIKHLAPFYYFEQNSNVMVPSALSYFTGIYIHNPLAYSKIMLIQHR
jgi:hypothetical protein